MQFDPAIPGFRDYPSDKLLGPFNAFERKNAPPRLYVAGDVSILERGARVSVVGSRKPTDAGLDEARAIARWLAGQNIVVVSGLAEGIDTAAHVATLEAKGRTIAVLGTSLSECFPSKNRALQEQIMRDHLAISQFPNGVPAERGNFPMRNRTMALIADATIIVEAKEGSGSLHQAWEAIRLGRPLFVVERMLKNTALQWPKELARYGAQSLDLSDMELLRDFLPERPREQATELAF